jgi:hypothetical protein
MIGNEKEPFNVVKTSTMHFYVDPLLAPALASFPWNRSKLMWPHFHGTGVNS